MTSLKKIIGYWENWENVTVWSGGVQNMCSSGCTNYEDFIEYTKPFTTVNYAFVLTSQNWYSGYDPDQSCAKYNKCSGQGGCPNCDKDNTWPASDGSKNLYWIAKCRGPQYFSPFMTMDTNISTPTNAILNVRELGRVCRQHPNGPKEFNISLGGWSDCITIKDPKDLAKIAANMVLYCFADGIDLDFEHFSIKTNGNDSKEDRSDDQIKEQIANFATFVYYLRIELDNNIKVWKQTIKDCNEWLESIKEENADYYNTNKFYLNDLCKIEKPSFTISYTTRFNSFVNSTQLGFNSNFITDKEGAKIFDYFKNTLKVPCPIDYVNFMNYDQDSPPEYSEWFEKIITETLKSGYIKKEQIICGIEPGIQAGAPKAPDQSKYFGEIIDKVNKHNTGGIMIWAINNVNDKKMRVLTDDIISKFVLLKNIGNKYSLLPRIFSLSSDNGYIYNKQCKQPQLLNNINNNINNNSNKKSKNNSNKTIILVILSLLILYSLITISYSIYTKMWLIDKNFFIIVLLLNIFILTLSILNIISILNNSKSQTQRPIPGPTQRPTQGPTQRPTQGPTQGPTQRPTQGPIPEPTKPPGPCTKNCNNKNCGDCDNCGGTCFGDCPVNKNHPGTAFCYKTPTNEYRNVYNDGTNNPIKCTGDNECHSEIGYYCDPILKICAQKKKDCCLSICDLSKPCGEQKDNCTNNNYCLGKCSSDSEICNTLTGKCEQNIISPCQICSN